MANPKEDMFDKFAKTIVGPVQDDESKYKAYRPCGFGAGIFLVACVLVLPRRRSRIS